ncbi:MAG: hypothetical protein OXN84_05330 [Albidovulum sp.]|nr:hypothetical protein [Albidovulum sp.]MDE0532637.1 hypothetical protein [Albidovulum sp.]
MDIGKRRIRYESLTAKQKEIYNFQKVAALLAEFGFNCMKLPDDWKGADFIAHHIDGTTLRVQLKPRPSIDKKYQYKELWIAFKAVGRWYFLPHDKLVVLVGENTPALQSASWAKGFYSWKPNGTPAKLMKALESHVIDQPLEK